MAMGEHGCDSNAAASSSSAMNSWWACMSDSGHDSSLRNNWRHQFNNISQPWRPPVSGINKTSRRNVDPSFLPYACDHEEQICTNSFTNNASNVAALSVESQDMVDSRAHMDLSLEPTTDPHIWNQVFVGVGSNGKLASNLEDDSKVLGALSYKDLRAEMFEGACDQMKRPENWEFSNYNGGYDHDKLNYLVNRCSIASSENQLRQNVAEKSASSSFPNLSSSLFLHQESNLTQIGPRTEIEQISPSSSSYSDGSSVMRTAMSPAGFMQCFTHNLGEGKLVEAPNNPIFTQTGDRNNLHSIRNVADFIHFGGGLNKPLLDFQASKTHMKDADLQDYRKYFPETSLLSRDVAKFGNSNEGKKMLEDEPNVVSKKQKQEGSSIPSSKLQVSKVKLGDRITALQQIVAPFGKTDTASVLLEAITYIKYMQEQVTLLVNHPYVKPNQAKQGDYSQSWGGGTEKKACESKLDLRSRGLCLVPISCTPQVYRESTGVDCWTPTYRGGLYR